MKVTINEVGERKVECEDRSLIDEIRREADLVPNVHMDRLMRKAAARLEQLSPKVEPERVTMTLRELRAGKGKPGVYVDGNGACLVVGRFHADSPRVIAWPDEDFNQTRLDDSYSFTYLGPIRELAITVDRGEG